jgi:hypothetical protein
MNEFNTKLINVFIKFIICVFDDGNPPMKSNVVPFFFKEDQDHL